MNDLERLAIAQAIYSEAGKMCDTKNPDSLRAGVDFNMIEDYAETHVDRKRIEINGEKVGTISLRFSKPTPEKQEAYFNVYDYVLLGQWFAEVTGEELREYCYEHLREFAEYKWKKDGEIAYGCNIETLVIPAAPSEVIGTLLKVDSKAVINSLKELPSGEIAGLLGGADE